MNRRDFLQAFPFVAGLLNVQPQKKSESLKELQELESAVRTLEQRTKEHGMEWRKVMEQRVKESVEMRSLSMKHLRGLL